MERINKMMRLLEAGSEACCRIGPHCFHCFIASYYTTLLLCCTHYGASSKEAAALSFVQATVC